MNILIKKEVVEIVDTFRNNDFDAAYEMLSDANKQMIDNIVHVFTNDNFEVEYRKLSEDDKMILNEIYFAIHPETFDKVYEWLVDTKANDFSKTGYMDGCIEFVHIDGEQLIERLISHYEAEDTVEGYQRCGIAKKLLDKYKINYSTRFINRFLDRS